MFSLTYNLVSFSDSVVVFSLKIPPAAEDEALKLFIALKTEPLSVEKEFLVKSDLSFLYIANLKPFESEELIESTCFLWPGEVTSFRF